MGKIIMFPVERAHRRAANVRLLNGASAEIIIFPGIRFERHDTSVALVK